MPAPQTEQENCVAHNGSLVPVPGRDIMVQAWYQGGVSMFDFTDAAKPVEIAFFDRGPLSATELITGGFWSTYWYNGYIYGTEIARGIDIFRLKPSEFLSQNEIDAAKLVGAQRLQRRRSSRRSRGRRSRSSRGRISISSRARAPSRRSARRRSRPRSIARSETKPGDKSAPAVREALTTLPAALEGCRRGRAGGCRAPSRARRESREPGRAAAVN